MAISFKDVLRARDVIGAMVHRTPVHRCSRLDQLARLQLYFKCENFQKTGSFKVNCKKKNSQHFTMLSSLKIRGALNAAKSCNKSNPILVTHSSGNHAQGVAMAGKLCGYPVHVVMPEATIPAKKEAVLSMGGKVTTCVSTEQVGDSEL